MAEPGERQFRGPRPATGRRRGLVDTDRAPGTGQGDRRGQAVRPGPDDDRIDRPVARAAHGTRGLDDPGVPAITPGVIRVVTVPMVGRRSQNVAAAGSTAPTAALVNSLPIASRSSW